MCAIMHWFFAVLLPNNEHWISTKIAFFEFISTYAKQFIFKSKKVLSMGLPRQEDDVSARMNRETSANSLFNWSLRWKPTRRQLLRILQEFTSHNFVGPFKALLIKGRSIETSSKRLSLLCIPVYGPKTKSQSSTSLPVVLSSFSLIWLVHVANTPVVWKVQFNYQNDTDYWVYSTMITTSNSPYAYFFCCGFTSTQLHQGQTFHHA